jgi:amidase
MAGKTITDDLTRGILGENPHYGTPINPRAPGRVPGGSSSGSASAVAGELVDFALGCDTGGSVRAPASFCGLYGLRPTHGRIPLDGVLPQASSYDTVGWFARDDATFARVGAVLLGGRKAPARPSRLAIAEDAFEVADATVAQALQPSVDTISSLIGNSTTKRLAAEGLAAWAAQQRTLQGKEAWETARDWIHRVNPRFSYEVAERYAASSMTTDAELEAARSARAEIAERMDGLLAGGTVVCLPTTPTPAPPVGEPQSNRLDVGWRITMLTCIAGSIGGPQISLPLTEVGGLPVGLSLIGARGSDEMLIAFASEVASARGR